MMWFHSAAVFDFGDRYMDHMYCKQNETRSLQKLSGGHLYHKNICLYLSR